MKNPPLTLAALGLCALAPAAFSSSALATTPSPNQTVYAPQSSGNFSFTPVNVPSAGKDDTVQFVFGPGANFAPAEITASNFTYTGNFTVDENAFIAGVFSGGVTGHYSYTVDGNNQVNSVSLYNNGAATPLFGSSPDDGKQSTTQTTTSVSIPFSSVGSMANYTLNYMDPPSNATFDIFEGSTPLLEGSFDSSGNFTSTPGFTAPAGANVQFSVAPNAPPAGGGTTAVPEPSSLALLGLGALPLIGLARRRRA